MKRVNVLINKLDVLTDIIQVYGIKQSEIKIKKNKQFLHIFTTMKDFRKKGKTIYRLDTLLLIIFFAKMNEEGSNCNAIARYARLNYKFLAEEGVIEKKDDWEKYEEAEQYKIPSHDCFRYFILNFDPNELKKAFVDRITRFMDSLSNPTNNSETGYKLLNVDGQEFRGTGRSQDTNNPRSNFATLNIYDASNGVCICSKSITKKESEVPIARELLSCMCLKNRIVTADGLHTARETADLILRKKGNYVMNVKSNQPSLLEDVMLQLSTKEFKKTTLETDERTLTIMEPVTLYDGEPVVDFPGIKTYIKSVSKIKKTEGSILYFISSLTNNEAIKEAIENRWDIENGLHKGKDFYLDEDEFRINDKNAVENFSVINNIIYSFFKIAHSLFVYKTFIETRKRFKLLPAETLTLMISLITSKQFEVLINNRVAQ